MKLDNLDHPLKFIFKSVRYERLSCFMMGALGFSVLAIF